MANVHDQVLRALGDSHNFTYVEDFFKILPKPSAVLRTWLWANYPSKLLGRSRNSLGYTRAITLLKKTDRATVERIASLPYHEMNRGYYVALFSKEFELISRLLDKPISQLTGPNNYSLMNTPALKQWSKVLRGRDLFIAGLGTFDINKAADALLLNQQNVSVNNLQSMGYFGSTDMNNLLGNGIWLPHVIKYKKQWQKIGIRHAWDFHFRSYELLDILNSGAYLKLSPSKLFACLQNRQEETRIKLAAVNETTITMDTRFPRVSRANTANFTAATRPADLKAWGDTCQTCIGSPHYAARALANVDEFWHITLGKEIGVCQINKRTRVIAQLKGVNNTPVSAMLRKLTTNYLTN